MKSLSTFEYTHPGGRDKNEDVGFLRVGNGTLTAVLADGLGGEGEGSLAARLAVETLLETALPQRMEPETLRQAFHRADERIVACQRDDCRMKTTAVCLTIDNDRALWGHIGDSRLYHFYEGTLVQVTLDHSVPQLSVFLGEIAREDIPRHPERNCLLKALGCGEVEAELSPVMPLSPGRHGFLLCTDGFWECFSDEELTQALALAVDAEQWLNLLRQKMQPRMKKEHDNNTAIAVILEV